MKTTVTTTVKLTPDDLAAIIRSHFDLPETAKVYFSVGDTSDDRFGGSPSYNLTGASLDMEVEVANLKGKK